MKPWRNALYSLAEAAKQRVRTSSVLWYWVRLLRARSVERAYRQRREAYARMSVRHHQRPERARDASRKIGEVHTYALVPSISWHDALLPELELLGPVSRFDYSELVRYGREHSYTSEYLALRRRINSDLLRHFEQVHDRHPVDWLFAYAQGDRILAETILAIRERFGVPCANMCLDDKQSWNSGTVGEQINGSQGLVAAFDLWWTSARVVVDWVHAEGGQAIYLPEGCNPALFYPTYVPYDLPVSFVGACYGPRPLMIDFLRRHGVPVQVFGRGWGKGTQTISEQELVDVFRRSQINLGSGAVLHSERITNVKARDFEVPCTEGGIYLTTFNADLAQHFHVGSEILCWHSYDEMLELIRYYLDRPDECREMAMRARERCLREHRWIHRYIRVLQVLGILDDDAKPPPVGVENSGVEQKISKYT
jgi:spore maturation protein CgeB